MKNAAVFWVIVLAVLLVYILTLCPTVYWFDSGELVTAAATLSVPHAPGAALYCLLGKAFLFLLPEDADPAWKVNLMTALLGALAAGAAFLLFSTVTSRPLAATGALLFAFSRQFWNVSTLAEIYSLFMLLVILLLLFFLRWTVSGRPALLYTAAFVFGLGMTLRPTLAIYLPALAVFFWMEREHRPLVRPWKLAAGFLLGYALILYVPFRAGKAPLLDSVALNGWMDHVTFALGLSYGKWVAHMPLSALPGQFWFFGNGLWRQFTAVGLALGLWGILASYRTWSRKTWTLFLLLFLSDVLFYTQVYPSENRTEHFFLTSFLIFSAWTAMGISDFGSRILDFGLKVFKLRCVNKERFQRVGSLLLAGVFILGLMAVNWAKVDKHDYVEARRYAENVLRSSPLRGVVCGVGDREYHPIKYVHVVMGVRPDLHVWYHPEVTPDLLFERQDPNIYLTSFVEGYLGMGACLIPQGPVWKIMGVTYEEAVRTREQPRVLDPRSGFSGLRITERSVRAGGVLPVEIFWRRPASGNREAMASVFIFTRDGTWKRPDGRVWFAHVHAPLYDRIPSIGLPPGRAARETYGWIIPADLPTGTYRLDLVLTGSQWALDTLASVKPDLRYFDNYDRDNPEFLKYGLSQGGWERGHDPRQMVRLVEQALAGGRVLCGVGSVKIDP